jgi:predicted permease
MRSDDPKAGRHETFSRVVRIFSMSVKHALRRLAHAPGFTLITILTLAIGIGANSAIFSVIEGVLLKPLPYPRAAELAMADHAAPGINIPDAGAAPFLYFVYREQSRAFQNIGLWQIGTSSIVGLAEPEEVPCIRVTADVLPALGVAASLGRWFSAQDDSPGPGTVVLMYGYWRTRFGGDAGVIGRRIMIDGTPHEVIGVMPESFRFLSEHASVLLPLQFDRSKTFLGNFSYSAIARLKPGVSMATASADMARLIPVSLDTFPPFPGYSKRMFEEARIGPLLKPLKDSVIGNVSDTLWVLMGTIGVVLLIACANVANLLLVRAEGREQELVIRAALGAGWARIARELLAESVALGLAGGVAGLALAYAALRILIAMSPGDLPRIEEISIDPIVLAFTLVVSLVAGVLFGLIPVVKYAGPHLATSIRVGGRTASSSRERNRVRNGLAVVQIALALVLLIGSGLMIRTFDALRHVNPGFTRPAEVQTMSLSIPQSQVPGGADTIRMEQAILDKIAAIPGVESVGNMNVIPMSGGRWGDAIWAEDKPVAGTTIPPIRRYKFVSPGALGALGVPLVAGREFTWAETYSERPLAMLSENLARGLWGDPARALGKRIKDGPDSPWHEVIGVVADEHEDGIDQDAPKIAYWPMIVAHFEGDKEQVTRTAGFAVRSRRTGSHGFMEEIDRAVWSVNPNLPVAQVETLGRLVEKSMARTSFTLVMLAIAGAMAMLIGLVGIYGVISYSVAQRRREIGIRLALGAPAQGLMRMFVAQALTLGAVGVGCGLLAALAMTRLISSLLFHVSAIDPLTYVLVSAGLLIAASIASYLPALRATRVDPVEALRAD